jgi:hypothetical protein
MTYGYLICLCAGVLLRSMIEAHPSSFRVHRKTMSLVCAFVAALMLSLGTMHPEQPVSLTMDMVSFGFHDGDVPALASIQFGDAARQDGLLVPIHSRIPMGMFGLWMSMILAALLFVVPLLRNIGTQPWVKYAFWLPPTLVLIQLGLWLASVCSEFSQSEFANYLTEFDLASIASITYPNEPWSISVSWILVVVVGAMLCLSYGFLIGLLAPTSSQVRSENTPEQSVDFANLRRASSFSHPSFGQLAGFGVFIAAILMVSFPESTTNSVQWAAVVCSLFALISLIEERGDLKVWSALCCALVSLIGML